MLKKNYIYSLIIFITYLQADTPKIKRPTFGEHIHLMEERNWGEILKEKFGNRIPEDVYTFMCTPEAHEMLFASSGYPNKKKLGHDEERRVAYTGQKVRPNTIILTGSGKSTLEETKKSLTGPPRLTHNFFIDRNGTIHPVTKKDETVEQALEHRPFAVGVSCMVQDGWKQVCDMNSYGITISIIGRDDEEVTPEQTTQLVQLVTWLKDRYNITADQVTDYGLIAWPPERRDPQPHLPWETLAQHNLTLWPKDEEVATWRKKSAKTNVDGKTVLAISGSLHKLGIPCPPVINKDHPDFKQALKRFQKHYRCETTDGTLTEETIGKLGSVFRQQGKLRPDLAEIFPPYKG